MKITKENFNSVSNTVIDKIKWDIRDKVNAFLSDTGMSSEELGELLETTESDINAILRGESFSVETFAKILVACGFTMSITPLEDDEKTKNMPKIDDIQLMYTNTGILSEKDYDELIADTEALGIKATVFPFETSIEEVTRVAKRDGIPFVGVLGSKILPNEEGDRYLIIKNTKNDDVKYVRFADMNTYITNAPSAIENEQVVTSSEETEDVIEQPSQPSSPFASMEREQLVEIIENKIWDDEIDVDEATTEELVEFLEEKDRRIQEIIKLRGTDYGVAVSTDQATKSDLVNKLVERLSHDADFLSCVGRLVTKLQGNE